MKEDNTKREGFGKEVLTLFLMMFPSLLIAGDYGSLMTNLTIKGALIFYQFVVIKAVLDDYYKYK